jgi:hypothetical protein
VEELETAPLSPRLLDPALTPDQTVPAFCGSVSADKPAPFTLGDLSRVMVNRFVKSGTQPSVRRSSLSEVRKRRTLVGLFDTLLGSVGSGQNSAIGNTLLSLLASESGRTSTPDDKMGTQPQPPFLPD